MTPEMNTAGLGGLKKIRGIICTTYLEGKNEKEITHTMQNKKRWHFQKLINVSNGQDKFPLQMTTALVVLTAAKTRPVGFGCYYFTLIVTAVRGQSNNTAS